jgi:hypothetical protein
MSEKRNTRTSRHSSRPASAGCRDTDSPALAQVASDIARQHVHFDKVADLHRAIARELQICLEVIEREGRTSEQYRAAWVQLVTLYSELAKRFDDLLDTATADADHGAVETR